MYQVEFNARGPEKFNGGYCIATSSGCKKCHWFVRTSKTSVMYLGKKKTVSATICGFNKKFYDDMKHTVAAWQEPS
ncbi:hypothetical protein FACS1894190_01290 [Spirochaetia bacterium]|nr:hypothetical protein FACS1894190_01290 [Spirochaetia bacterium]